MRVLPIYAQDERSKVLRTERLELVSKEGAVLGTREVGYYRGHGTAVLKLTEQAEREPSQIAIYPHSVQLKQGAESAMLAAGLGLSLGSPDGDSLSASRTRMQSSSRVLP